METKQLKEYYPFESGMLLIAVMFVVSIVAVFAQKLEAATGEYFVYINYAITPIAILGVFSVYTIVAKKDFCLLPIKQTPHPVGLALSAVLGVGVLCLLMIANYGGVYIGSALGVDMSVTMPPTGTAWQWVLSIICVCVLPALAEEFVFRGMVLSSVRKGGDIFAILISALVFALFHFSLAQSVYPFLYGAVLGYIVVKTDNIWYGVTMHFVNNLVTVVLNATGAIAFLGEFSLANIGVLAAICAGGAGVTTVAALLLFRVVKKDIVLAKAAERAPQEKKVFGLGVAFLVGILAVTWLCMVIYNIVTK